MSPADIWVLSNGVGGLAFASLTVLLLAGTHSGKQGRWLTFACGANALWCLLLASAIVFDINRPTLNLVETIRDGIWLVFIATILPRASTIHRRSLRRLVSAAPVILAIFLLWRAVSGEGESAPLLASSVFYIGAVAIAFSALVMLEQIYRSANPDQRWGLKYLVLAIGVMFAYDFVLYSQALLYMEIPLGAWEARGAVNALLVPFIAVSAARNPAWSATLRFSHQAAFHGSAALVAGAYLLFTALGGYYIRNFGGTWGEFVGVLFLVSTLLFLGVVVLSGQVRASAKVYIKKHFFDYKYDYRAEWLGLTERLGDAREIADPYQRSIHAVAHILDSPAGALWLLRDGKYVCASQWNIPQAEDAIEPIDSSLVRFMQERSWIVDLAEYGRDPRQYESLTLPGWLDAIPRARLIMPMSFESTLLGFMLLALPRAKYVLTWEDLDLLRTLGSQVGSFLGQQESQIALTQARQFEAYNRLTAFLMHDLKNIASQQSLIVQNAHKHKHNPEFIDDMIMTVDTSVVRMRRLLEQLQRSGGQGQATRRVEVNTMLCEVLSGLTMNTPAPGLTSEIKAFVRVDPERFAMILGHIVRNAQEATGPRGNVDIAVSAEKDQVRISVVDNGVGMTPAFVRDSLFKPFYSTKAARGMGIGAYQARDFAKAAGGDVEVDSEPGKGTTFTIVLPAVAVISLQARRAAGGMR